MKKNYKKFVALCSVLVAAFTVVVAVNTKTESKAFDWFGGDKISVKKCAISFYEDTYNWTGSEIKPEVRVNYLGTDLEKNVDYIVSYKDNIDAGEGKVVIEGKGNYKGKETVKFKIKGIDFKNECIASITNGVVQVFYKGKLLTDGKDYYVMHLTQEILEKSQATGNGYLNTYKVTDYYTITGKGKFDGCISNQIVTSTVKFEKSNQIDFDGED
ncbi:MAG: hypothetical protein E7262_02020 [Lachnospiraceae bacterium]|nr:hypothetical protein [Lachnospiraceae bacterium]